MEDEGTLVSQSYQLIIGNLGLKENSGHERELLDFETLEDELSDRIKSLLDSDFNKLLNALYRIDLEESQLNHILNEVEPDEIAKQLAKAVIQRVKQKLITRRRYRHS